MKRLGLLAMIVAAVLCGPAARADFYVIAVPAGVGTKITSVPYTISNPGFYYFGKNLTYSGSGNAAITVNADNVTLDLMGFSLTKDGALDSTYGIYLNGRTNVEIRNGTVCNFSGSTAILEASYSGKNHRVINVRVTNNSNGIMLNGTNHFVNSCTASHNNSYIGIYASSGIITKCSASNNWQGIVLYYGAITECVVTDNTRGIELRGPGNVLGNTVYNNSMRNFDLGNGVATAIMADRNSASGLSTNYYIQPGTTGVQWGINAGSP